MGMGVDYRVRLPLAVSCVVLGSASPDYLQLTLLSAPLFHPGLTVSANCKPLSNGH